MFLKLLYIEQKKTKRSFAFWLTLFGSLVIPMIVFLVMLIKPAEFAPAPGKNPWESLFYLNFKFVCSFFFPMYIIYLIGLLGNLEYKSSNWKKLFVLPIRKELLVSGKLTYVVLHIFFAILLFATYTLTLGYLAGLIHSELGLTGRIPPSDVLFWLIYHLFLSVLGIIGIQFILSIFFENLLITLAIGLFAIIGALIASQLNWEYIEYVPYAAPNRFGMKINGMTEWINKQELVSLLTFAAAFVAAIFFFKRKTVK